MHDPLRDELAASERIVRARAEVMPRWRIITPEGEFVVMTQMGDDMADRAQRLALMSGFMAWKAATGFVFSVETWLGGAGTHQDDGRRQGEAIVSFAVTQDGTHGAMREIRRDPLRFGPPQWLGPEHADPMVLDLLPGKAAAIDAPTLARLKMAFGPSGWLEARRVR